MIYSPLVYVIILNYNGMKYLNQCLSSIETQTYPNYRVVVFDNASTDGSVEYISRAFPNIILLRGERNFGFAKGNNIATKFVLKRDPDYIFLLNNDTAVERELLEKLVNVLERDASVGIVAPAVYDYEDKTFVHELGMAIDRFGYPLSLKNVDYGDHLNKVFFVSGCAMMAKASVLRKIGLFDEKYFMFAEDLDLCWRAQLAGFRVVIDQSAKVFHVSGGSISGGVIKTKNYKTNVKRVFLRERNTLRTLLKNYDMANLIKTIFLDIGLLYVECVLWTFSLNLNTTLSICKAIIWNLRFFRDTWLQRLRVQSMRTMPDSLIIENMVKGYGKFYIFRIIGLPTFGS